ncbi:MAG: hypothetical protein IKI76_09430 [Selenomonadaceae bacterium]|nr:hypothetical protein [Selenomonadaceae bacterium]
MFYRDLNEIRCRSNLLSVILNEATNYSRRPLPAEFADVKREWDELTYIWQQPVRLGSGVEIAEANLEDINHDFLGSH